MCSYEFIVSNTRPTFLANSFIFKRAVFNRGWFIQFSLEPLKKLSEILKRDYLMKNTIKHNHGLVKKSVAFASILTITGASLLMSGCATPKLSDSLYRVSEVGVSKQTLRCRVLEVREVAIRDDERDAEGTGLFGAMVGGIVGATLGNSVGNGLTNLLATEVAAAAGVAAGGIAGSKIGDKMSERSGLEYSIILTSGEERTLVQEFLPADRVLAVNDSCRLQVASDGRNRVLPAEHLPTEVYAPKTTALVQLPR
ncbi:MAG: hypothetical protein H6984_03360 [Pseudomonadales bacterium]|nr:hypothetical protein [Halioglobus sp.]MCP5121479.1 hypothetical protein [Pseudomonadales bacterium]MCP5193180.1 hypothetical protein [Pseudomonadales bacterium]